MFSLIYANPAANLVKINKAKILVIEDDRPTLDAIVFKLKSKGYEIDFALDGEEALKAINKKTYDLILLDLLLPKVNGLFILEELRRDSLSKNAKVLVFSNLAQEEDIAKAAKLGISAYLIKAESKIEDIVKKSSELLEG